MSIFIFFRAKIAGLQESLCNDENLLGFRLARKEHNASFNSIRCADRCQL